MHHIDIDRHRRSVWPWIIALVMLAALFWAIADLIDPGANPEANANAETEVQVVEPPAATVPEPQEQP